MSLALYTHFALAARRARRAAGIATASMGGGPGSDMEMSVIRADIVEDTERLTREILTGRYDDETARDSLQLGEALREMSSSALGAAWILRGKIFRVWGLFDRVRLLSGLTEHIAHLAELLETAAPEDALLAFSAFYRATERMPAQEDEFREDKREASAPLSEWLLILRLEAWRRAIFDAAALFAVFFAKKQGQVKRVRQ